VEAIPPFLFGKKPLRLKRKDRFAEREKTDSLKETRPLG
jgi:hypothetical protein